MSNNYVKVKIEGKNVHNYIKWLVNKKMNIAKLKIINNNELNVVIDYNDYDKLLKYSKTYKVQIIKKYGKLRLFEIIRSNSIILSCLILSIIFLYFLSNVIFSIDIIYNDKEIVEKVYKELQKYDIKKYRFKKKYTYLNQVKEKILNDNKDMLEWIEIEEIGTKYVVRLVERKKEIEINDYDFQSIVAKKDAIIKSIKAFSGEKNKNVNQYVKKGDVIINGILLKPDGTNLYTKAKGIVTGEVWYKVDVEYPLYYREEKVTGKNKFVLSVYFLNYKIPLFPYTRYKQFRLESNVLIDDNFIPFKIAKEKMYEVIVKEEIYTEEEAIEKAIEFASKKLLISNNSIIKIDEVEILNKQNLNSKIKLSLFVSVVEDITDIIEIKEDLDNYNN